MTSLDEFITSIKSLNFTNDKIHELIKTKIKADADILAREKEAKIKADVDIKIARIRANKSPKNKVFLIYLTYHFLFLRKIIYLFKIDGVYLYIFTLLLGFFASLFNLIKVFVIE